MEIMIYWDLPGLDLNVSIGLPRSRFYYFPPPPTANSYDFLTQFSAEVARPIGYGDDSDIQPHSFDDVKKTGLYLLRFFAAF